MLSRGVKYDEGMVELMFKIQTESHKFNECVELHQTMLQQGYLDSYGTINTCPLLNSKLKL